MTHESFQNCVSKSCIIVILYTLFKAIRLRYGDEGMVMASEDATGIRHVAF